MGGTVFGFGEDEGTESVREISKGSCSCAFLQAFGSSEQGMSVNFVMHGVLSICGVVKRDVRGGGGVEFVTDDSVGGIHGCLG